VNVLDHRVKRFHKHVLSFEEPSASQPVIFKLKCNNLILNEIMVLNVSYVFACILASSRITQSRSSKTDPSFLMWFYHRMISELDRD
jgi:hypothetical protein